MTWHFWYICLMIDYRVKALHHNAVSQRKTLNTLVNIIAIERAFEPGRMRKGVGVF